MVHQVRVPAPHVQADASSIRLTGDTVGMGIGVGSSLYLRRDVGTVWFRPRRAVADGGLTVWAQLIRQDSRIPATMLCPV